MLVVIVVARLLHYQSLFPAGMTVMLASAYHLSWWRSGIEPVTRYLSAVALVGQPALLIVLLAGHAWQADMHMYFFAILALTIGLCDWKVIVVAAVAITVHHLLLDLLLPFAVFDRGEDFARVCLHAAIVALETGVLCAISSTLAKCLERARSLTAEVARHNFTLEGRVLARTQEVEAANQAKGQFLANKSHEIRTPLNAIIGFCHLVLRTGLTDKQHDYLFKMKDAGDSLLALINGLGIDGYEVCRRLKANPLVADMPIIFVTGQNDQEAEVQGLRLGAIDYLTKPISPVIVRARVRNHLEMKFMRDRLAELAATDALTGMNNRRRLEQCLRLETARLARSDDWLSVIMADIDFFKQFNDT